MKNKIKIAVSKEWRDGFLLLKKSSYGKEFLEGPLLHDPNTIHAAHKDLVKVKQINAERLGIFDDIIKQKADKSGMKIRAGKRLSFKRWPVYCENNFGGVCVYVFKTREEAREAAELLRIVFSHVMPKESSKATREANRNNKTNE